LHVSGGLLRGYHSQVTAGQSTGQAASWSKALRTASLVYRISQEMQDANHQSEYCDQNPILILKYTYTVIVDIDIRNPIQQKRCGALLHVKRRHVPYVMRRSKVRYIHTTTNEKIYIHMNQSLARSASLLSKPAVPIS
jgi:hypothetical protein